MQLLSDVFKRAADPHGCPAREGHNCLGVRMHCRLEADHAGTHAMEVSTPYHLKVWGEE